jgi:hypothetical protein
LNEFTNTLHWAKCSDVFGGHLIKSMDEYLGSCDYSLKSGSNVMPTCKCKIPPNTLHLSTSTKCLLMGLGIQG